MPIEPVNIPIRVQGIILPLVFKFLVTDKSLAWRYDHHIDWGDPITPTTKAA